MTIPSSVDALLPSLTPREREELLYLVTTRKAPEWTPLPKQREFLARTEDEVLYGGAAGSGKTDCLLQDLIWYCEHYPGAQTMLVRRQLTELRKPGSAIPRSHSFLTGRASWNGSDNRWTFNNGSVLQFGHCESEADVYTYKGAQLDRLAFDELTEFSEFQYLFLTSRVRANVPGIKTGIRAGTNPGGIGHGWVRDRFVDHAAPGETRRVVQWVGDEQRETTLCFIPARVYDNTALLERDPDYPFRLKRLGDALSRALLEGDWDQFEGQVFTEWRRDAHVVASVEVGRLWPKWRAIDYGYHAPFCCLWLTRSPDGGIYVYREAYETGKRDSEQAMLVRLLTGDESIRQTFADPSMWATTPSGSTIAAAYAEWGVLLSKANNDRLNGWQTVHRALAHNEKTRPVLRVFSTCTNLVRTLPTLVYDRANVEDVDTDGEDHAADALRYALMGMWAARSKPPASSVPYSMGQVASSAVPVLG